LRQLMRIFDAAKEVERKESESTIRQTIVRGQPMKSRLTMAVAFVAVMVGTVLAGSPHFVGTPLISTTGDTAFVSGKVAGLGNVPQIHVTLTGFAECVNRGSNKPSAANKESFTVEGDFPVQNGKALFQLALDATFSPDCVPPMTVVWSGLSVTVTAEDGTFLTYP
jgi:hypothetical protein